jgi:hypothetical protein
MDRIENEKIARAIYRQQDDLISIKIRELYTCRWQTQAARPSHKPPSIFSQLPLF